MPREGKTSITIDKAVFRRLKDEKPDGVTWDYYLDTLRENYTLEKVVSDE